MKTTSVFSQESAAPPADGKIFFNVVIIYDHRDMAIRAKGIFDRLMTRFWDEFCFQCDFWRFDVLNVPEARQQASWAGQIADLIIIASESGEASQTVKVWLQNCVVRKNEKPSAVVELFGDGAEPNNLQPEMREFLKPFASGLNFFVHEIESPKMRARFDQNPFASPSLFWTPPSTAWGINE